MTREHKLALIVGFSLVLVLGVLISDHFSKARTGAPLAVEIRDTTLSPFGPSSANAAPVATPATTLPSSQPPTARVLDPIPGGPGAPLGPRAGDIAMGNGRGVGAPVSELPLSTVPLVNTTTTPITPVPPQTGAALPVSTGALKRYDVKENDSMYTIARKYYGDGNLWTKLRDYNKGRVTENGGMRDGITLEIPPRDVLDGKARLGDQRLVQGSGPATVPGPAGVVVTPPKTDSGANKTDTKTDPKAAGYASYTVQDGDTLYSIARKKLGSTKRMQDLIDANKGQLSSPDELKVGMTIRIPAR